MLEGTTTISYCLKPATPCDSNYVACPLCRASVSTALCKMIDIAQRVANRNFNFKFPGTSQASNATTAHMHHRKNFLHHSRRKFRPDTGTPSENCWLHNAKLCRINTISHCDTARWTIQVLFRIKIIKRKVLYFLDFRKLTFASIQKIIRCLWTEYSQ